MLRLLLDPTAESGGAPAAPLNSESRTGSDLNAVQVPERESWNGAPSASTSPSPGENAQANAPAQSVSGVGELSSPPAQAGGLRSIREVARELGYEGADQYADDRQFLVQTLAQAKRNQEADYYARLGRQLAPHAQQIQGYIQQGQPNQTQQRPEWQVPEFDERWISLVDRDAATGSIFAKPGVPIEIAQKVSDYLQWKAKFDLNPMSVIMPAIEHQAKQLADQRFGELYAQREQAAQVQSITESHADWLYQKDQAGRTATDYQGRPMLTPAGARYAQFVDAYAKAGVRDVRLQDQFARQAVAGELALAQGQRGQNTQVQSQNAQARANQNPLQALPINEREVTAGATEPSHAGTSLSDQLKRNLRESGIRDEDIFGSFDSA